MMTEGTILETNQSDSFLMGGDDIMMVNHRDFPHPYVFTIKCTNHEMYYHPHHLTSKLFLDKRICSKDQCLTPQIPNVAPFDAEHGRRSSFHGFFRVNIEHHRAVKMRVFYIHIYITRKGDAEYLIAVWPYGDIYFCTI